jgi:hypothetical protein
MTGRSPRPADKRPSRRLKSRSGSCRQYANMSFRGDDGVDGLRDALRRPRRAAREALRAFRGEFTNSVGTPRRRS